MRRLPLFQDQQTPVEEVDPLPLSKDCRRCSLHQGVKTVCMSPAVAQIGDSERVVLFLGDRPGKHEDISGRPFSGAAGNLLKIAARKHWDGIAVFDTAVRCKPGATMVSPAHLNACRPYLADTLAETRPERIVALSSAAVQALLGASPAMFSARKGYAWVGDTPVFLLMHPTVAARNRFVRGWFQEDLEWALTVPLNRLRTPHGHCLFIETRADAERAAMELRRQPWVCFDCEWAGKPYSSEFEVVTIGFSGPRTAEPFVLERDALLKPAVREPLLDLLADPAVKVGNHNIKDDMVAVHAGFGVHVTGVAWDTMVDRRMFESDALQRLEACQWQVGYGGGKDEMGAAIKEVTKRCRRKDSKARGKVTDRELDAIGPRKWVDPIRDDPTAKPKTWAYGLVNSDTRGRYCAIDARSTAYLRVRNEALLVSSKLDYVQEAWEDIIGPAIPAIAQVEYWGVPVDTGAINTFIRRVQTRLGSVESRLAPYNINFGSTQQLQTLLFKRLKLPVLAKTKTGQPSTDKAVLEQLSDKHPVVRDLLEFRSLQKDLTTFAQPMLKHVRDDGRVHPRFNVTGARTGRLSCEDPNLHQVKRSGEDEFSKLARNCFAVGKGKRLIVIDYSQMELRAAAFLSRDAAMAGIFKRGEDFHKGTASIAFGKRLEDVSKQERTFAKSVNFGLVFGQGDGALAANLGVSVAQAAKVRRSVLGGFPDLARTIDAWVRESKRTGLTWTYNPLDLDRRARCRQLHKIASPDGGEASNAENGAKNTPIQGTSGDYCTIAVGRIVRWLVREKIPAKIVLMVHDSVFLECENSVADEVADGAMWLMTDFQTRGVPLVVDAEHGERWGELEPM